MKVQTSTFQLQVALNNSATSRIPGLQYIPGQQYKAQLNLENLNLKNVYLSRDGDIHVSKGGFSRMWAGLLGRKTGEAALRESMADRFKFSPHVIERAMTKINAFKPGQLGTMTLEMTIHRAKDTKAELIHPAKDTKAELAGGFVGTGPVAQAKNLQRLFDV